MGLSTRITKRDLEKHFSTEGKVEDIRLVVDPWTRESRGFGFVTMSSVKEADRCIKYLDQSVLEGRVITVEKARRRRGRTPTPGRYLGLRTVRARRRSPSYSPYYRSCSPRCSFERDGSRSRSPRYRRRSPYSPYYGRRGSYSSFYSRERSCSRSRSPYNSRRLDRSYSPYDSRYYSPDDPYYRRSHYRYCSVTRSISPRVRRSYSCSVSPSLRRSSRVRRSSRRSYSCSISPSPRRSSRRSYSCSVSPRRSYSRSVSPRPRRRSARGSLHKGEYSRDSHYSRSRSVSPSSRSVSMSVSPSP